MTTTVRVVALFSILLGTSGCDRTNPPVDLKLFAEIARKKVSPDFKNIVTCGHYDGKRLFSPMRGQKAGEWERVKGKSRAFAIFRNDTGAYDVVVININEEIVSAAQYYEAKITAKARDDRRISLSVIYPSDGNMESYMVFRGFDGSRKALFSQITTTLPSVSAIEAECLS